MEMKELHIIKQNLRNVIKLISMLDEEKEYAKRRLAYSTHYVGYLKELSQYAYNKQMSEDTKEAIRILDYGLKNRTKAMAEKSIADITACRAIVSVYDALSKECASSSETLRYWCGVLSRYAE